MFLTTKYEQIVKLEHLLCPKVGGGHKPTCAPHFWKWGGSCPPCPPSPTPLRSITPPITDRLSTVSWSDSSHPNRCSRGRRRRGGGAAGHVPPTIKSGGTNGFSPPPTFRQTKCSNFAIFSYFVAKNAKKLYFINIFNLWLTYNSRILFHIPFLNYLTIYIPHLSMHRLTTLFSNLVTIKLCICYNAVCLYYWDTTMDLYMQAYKQKRSV